MTDTRWIEMQTTPARAGAKWVALPENGWGAVIAYAAGPGRVRPHDAPLSARTVETTVSASGFSTSASVPMTPDDLAMISESIEAYLSEVGIAPPPVTWWEIDLPDDISYDQFDSTLEERLRKLYDSGGGSLEEEFRIITSLVVETYAAGSEPPRTTSPSQAP